jgi:hypothetical protein
LQAGLAAGVAPSDDEGEGEEGEEPAEEGEEPAEERGEGWVFGICWWRSQAEKEQAIPQETRFFAVQKRDRVTLQGLIQNHVAPGTQIWSDCWRSYFRLATLPEAYIHLTVNHSLYFTDPITGVNTNAIEGAWSRLRHSVVRTKRGVGRELRYHLAELWWKSLMRIPVARANRKNRSKTDPLIYMKFLNLISRAYAL